MSQSLHERLDFKNLTQALSAEMKISPQLIEKDYWTMHTLWGLNQLGFQYELKGGTSLSKDWKCIERFSEDIDLMSEAIPLVWDQHQVSAEIFIFSGAEFERSKSEFSSIVEAAISTGRELA